VFLGPLLVAVKAFRRGCQLRGFRYQDGFEEVWVQIANRASQPNVEEVGKRGIANVVVVGRVRADQKPAGFIPGTCGIYLKSVTAAS